MTSYNNNPEFKKKAIEAAIRHRDMDMLMIGTYGRKNIYGFKGCSVGCDYLDINGEATDKPHQTTADYFGFPIWMEHLRDKIFEGLEEADRVNWHVDIKQAIPIGMDEADFDKVKKDFLIWLMEENIKFLVNLDVGQGLKYQTMSVVQGSIKALKTGEGINEAYDVANAISEMTARAARAAGAAMAARAARAAMTSDVADSAAMASWAASYKKQSNKLIELFEAVKK